MRLAAWSIVLSGVLGFVGNAATLAADPGPGFERLVGPYESVRLALLNDTIDGVADAAVRIETEADAIESELREAATSGEHDASLRDLLPEIRSAAVELAGATDLEQARSTFGALSKTMVRYRQLLDDPEPVVVFCPMAQAVWVQPKGEIGNPYHGQSMARCGEIVSE